MLSMIHERVAEFETEHLPVALVLVGNKLDMGNRQVACGSRLAL